MKQIWDKLRKYSSILLALLVLCIGTALILADPVAPDVFEVMEGYPLPHDIYSEIDFETLDYEKSEAAGRIAEENMPRYYRLDVKKMSETS